MTRLGFQGVALVGLTMAAMIIGGCKPDADASRGIVEDIAASIKPGTTKDDIRKQFGEPQEIANEIKESKDKACIWRYKNLNEFYELWVRFASDKVTWTQAYDKSTKLMTESPGGNTPRVNAQ